MFEKLGFEKVVALKMCNKFNEKWSCGGESTLSFSSKKISTKNIKNFTGQRLRIPYFSLPPSNSDQRQGVYIIHKHRKLHSNKSISKRGK